MLHVYPDGIRAGAPHVGPHDLAAHSSKGLTDRTKVMFGPPGHAYVYLIYGMHYCMNVVTEPAGHGSAVLIRALEPVENLAGKASGPGLLCRAMGIDRPGQVFLWTNNAGGQAQRLTDLNAELLQQDRQIDVQKFDVTRLMLNVNRP